VRVQSRERKRADIEFRSLTVVSLLRRIAFTQRLIEGTDLKMKRPYAVLLLLVMAALGWGVEAEKRTRWVVYYSDAIPSETFEDFEIIVLDCDHYPPLAPLRRKGKRLLGYISLGEVESYRPHFAAVKADGILLQENIYWKGSYYVDLRDERWTARVIEKLVPGILAKGFDGLFLDTLDNAADLVNRDAEKYEGMTAAAADLVIKIRKHFPEITIMMNRAYQLLPKVEKDINIVLGESVFATYDFESKSYRWVPREEYGYQVNLLRAARKRCPSLRIFTLDYWNPEDHEGLRKIYRVQRANGFEPYVSTIELDRVVLEPR